MKPYKPTPGMRSNLNIFDKIEVTVSGKTFQNVFVKFLDRKGLEICLSATEARMLGETLCMRADLIEKGFSP